MGNLITIILLLSVFLTALSVTDDVSASSSIIYVNDSSGNDNNDGSTWLLAKKSIKNATKTVTNGGTVNIANGLYTGVKNTKIIIDKDITIRGQSKSGTIINGTNNAWIFKIPKGKNVVIQNLTLANGYRFVTERDENSDEIYDSDGGAIINKGTLTVEDSNFIGNTASDAGAICNWGTLTVVGSTFAGNAADLNGGAIEVLGTTTIINSIFTNNVASDGGAICKAADLTLKKCTFINNRAYTAGGAILNYADYGVLIMIDTIFATSSDDIWNITEFINGEDITDPWMFIESNDGNNTSDPAVKAASKTVGMQKTGIPIAGFVVAVLMVLSGLTIPRKK